MTPELTAAQAAGALGVRLATVYAYVSRGVLSRTVRVGDDGHRTSWFDRDEVLRLAALRQRPRSGALAVLVESSVTQLDPRGRLSFRGHDLADVLALGSFEAAAALVLDQPPGQPWPDADPAVLAPVLASGDGPTHASLSSRLRTAVTAGADGDPHRHNLAPTHVRWTAAQTVACGIAGIAGGVLPAPSGRVATDLHRALTGRPPTEPERALVDVVLTVLVDHELTASTLAARIAAGLHADPWSALLTGLHAMSGRRQAGAGGDAVALLDRWLAGSDPAKDSGEVPAGFGHAVYEGPDPRFEALLDVVAELDSGLHDAVVALTTEVAVRCSRHPNVDLGLAAAARLLAWPDGAADAVFMLARIPGLAAHLIEEYPHPLRFRSRSV